MTSATFEQIYIDLITNFNLIIELLLYFSLIVISSIVLIHYLTRRKANIISMTDEIAFGLGIALIIISFSEGFVVWFNFNPMLTRRLEMAFLALFMTLFVTRHRMHKNRLKPIINSNVILLLFILFSITLLNIILFFSANFNVGVFWDDICNYPWASNMYHNLGPTVRSPYVIWPALVKFVADSVNLPFQHGYALLSLFSGFIFLSTFSYFKSTIRNFRKTIIWLSVIIIIFGSNLMMFPLLPNLLGETRISEVFEAKVLYDYTVDKYGPPQIVGSWIYLKASSFGGGFILLSLAVLNFGKDGGFSKRVTLLLAILFFSYGLLGGNLLLAVMALPLFVYKMFRLGHYCSIFAFIASLLCLDAIFKFSFLNIIVIKSSRLIDNFIDFPTLWFSIALLPAIIIISKSPQILRTTKSSLRKVRRKFDNWFAKSPWGIILKEELIIAGMLIILFSIYLETLYFNAVRYSDMWKKNTVFSFSYVVVRTFGWSIPVAIFGIINLRDHRVRKEFSLWLIGAAFSLTIALIYSTADYLAIAFVNREISYVIFPFGLLILISVKNILHFKYSKPLIVFMILISGSYTFLFVSAYYTSGVNYNVPLYEKDLLVYISTLPKAGYILVHDLRDANLLSSLPDAKVIHAEMQFSSQKNDYAWYYWTLSEGDANSVRETIKKLEIKYIILNLKLLLNNQSRVLQNPNYMAVLGEFEQIYQQNNYVVYKTNLLSFYNSPKCPTIPSPLNNLLGMKNYEK